MKVDQTATRQWREENQVPDSDFITQLTGGVAGPSLMREARERSESVSTTGSGAPTRPKKARFASPDIAEEDDEVDK
jgi:hypothetical protein